MKFIVTSLLVFHLFKEAMSCVSQDACYVSKMKTFLDTASSFLKKAQDLTEGAKENQVPCSSKPMDCADIMRCGKNESGLYDIWPHSRITENKLRVFCDMTKEGGGWTVFQRRGAYGRNKDYFYSDWNSYKTGFGKITEDFWLGNDNLYTLTNQRLQNLRIDMLDLEKDYRYAMYDHFWIDGEEYNYTLHVKGYIGTAGDSFSGQSGFQFSTKDRDNDIYEGHCAQTFKGGWWYSKCHGSNLNGLYLNGSHTSYADGIEWSHWKGQNYSFPFVEMKIRPFSFSVNKDNTLE